MAFSVLLLVKSSFAWGSFVFGTLLNLFLIWLIQLHTPKEMRNYSKILLQTCVTDLLLLLATVLADNVRDYYFCQISFFFFRNFCFCS
jgi:uncharacterized SAM-binding protein YcdF (DUF218 family)